MAQPLPSLSTKGFTPLHTSALCGEYSNVERLLNRGLNIHARAKDGSSVLLVAATQGHESIVQLLLDRGANIEAKDKKGTTCLQRVSANGNVALVELFLKNGANIESKDREGLTALHKAVYERKLGAVETLLLHNADVNSRMKTGLPPLACAAKDGSIELVEILLKFGADRNCRDNKGYTVLHHAYCFAPDLFRYLLENYYVDGKALKEARIIQFPQKMNENFPGFADQGGHENVKKILAQHVIKILALKARDDVDDFFDVIMSFMDASPLWRDAFPTTSDDFKTRCTEEVARLKVAPLANTCMSLYDFLGKDVANVAFLLKTARITDADLKAPFPIYGSILVHHLHKGMQRKALMEEGFKICRSLFSLFKDLPYELKEKLLNYLTNRDILMLKHAVRAY